MSEHKIGEQWIVEIDGVRHMVKLCQSNPKEIGTCGGCIYHSWDEGDWCDVAPLKACVEFGYIIKDLGPVNEDGLLPCPFCGEYPNLENNGYFWYCCTNDDCLAEVGTGKTKQEAIDIWNRRA